MNQKKEWIILHKKVDKMKIMDIIFMTKNLPKDMDTDDLNKLKIFKDDCERAYRGRDRLNLAEPMLTINEIQLLARKLKWTSIAFLNIH